MIFLKEGRLAPRYHLQSYSIPLLPVVIKSSSEAGRDKAPCKQCLFVPGPAQGGLDGWQHQPHYLDSHFLCERQAKKDLWLWFLTILFYSYRDEVKKACIPHWTHTRWLNPPYTGPEGHHNCKCRKPRSSLATYSLLPLGAAAVWASL